MTDLKKDQIVGVRVIVAILLVALLALGGYKFIETARGAEPCNPDLPTPALVIRLSDGTEIPAKGLRYDLASRVVHVDIEYRLFCNGYEK